MFSEDLQHVCGEVITRKEARAILNAWDDLDRDMELKSVYEWIMEYQKRVEKYETP